MNFFTAFADKLDFIIVCLVIASGFFQKNYLREWNIVKDVDYNSALRTLFCSAIVSAIYILLLKDPEKANNWAQYFLSYFAATSFYELLLEPFMNWFKRRFGDEGGDNHGQNK